MTRAAPRKATGQPRSTTVAAAMSPGGLLADAFRGPSWDRWRAIMKAAFAEPMSDEDLRLFREVAGDRDPPERPVREMWIIVGRGGGKDAAASAIACVAATADYSAHLRPGERATILTVAADRDQARIARDYIGGYFEEIPKLRAFKEGAKETADGLELPTRVDIKIGTNSFRTIRGRRVVCAILDEVAFFRTDNAAASDYELYAALGPSLARTPGSLLIGISSPFKKSGLLYDKFTQHFGKNADDILVIKGTTTQFNPTFDQRRIDADMLLDPERFAAEYYGEWRSDLSDLFDRETVLQAVDTDVVSRPPDPRHTYQMYADPSGGRGDAFSVAIAHAEGDLVVVDLVMEWLSPSSPDDVIPEIAALAREYRITRLVGDKYAAELVTARFAKNGLFYESTGRDRSSLYLNALPLFTSSCVRLPNVPRLVNQLTGLKRKTTNSGKDIIDHQVGQYDDLANSAAGVATLVASDARPALIKRDDLLAKGEAVTAHIAPDAIIGTMWCDYSGGTGWTVTTYSQLETPQLIIHDFGRGFSSLDDIYKAVVPAMREAHDAACSRGRGPGPHLYLDVPDQWVERGETAMYSLFHEEARIMSMMLAQHGVARQMLDVRPTSKKLMDDAERMLMNAGAHIGKGDVKLGPAALAKSRELPLFGVLGVKAGERIDADVLRVALLLAVSGLSPEPKDPVGARMRWGS